MNKLKVYKDVALRPISATQMLWNHRRTLAYLFRQHRYRNLYNHIFTTYFIRGEDCGKGILDPLWKLTGWAPFLWDIELEVTTRCYLQCIHCEHTYWPKPYLNQDLSYEGFRKIIDGIPSLKWINLTGEGSAFLNKDFVDMVLYCKEKGLYVDFSHDFARWPFGIELMVGEVDRIYWSFDGCTKETYERVRVGAKFDEVVSNVKRLISLKGRVNSPLPEICFRFAFFKHNIQELSLVPAFLASLVDDVKDYGDEPSINFVSLLEFEESKDWVVELPPGMKAQVNADCRRLGFKAYWSHPTHNEEDKPPLDYCTFWSEPYIMITGHAVPCCGVLMSNNRPTLERLAFGNVYEQGLKEIWDSDRYGKFRKMVVNPKGKVPEVCLGCRVFNTRERERRYGVA